MSLYAKAIKEHLYNFVVRPANNEFPMRAIMVFDFFYRGGCHDTLCVSWDHYDGEYIHIQSPKKELLQGKHPIADIEQLGHRIAEAMEPKRGTVIDVYTNIAIHRWYPDTVQQIREYIGAVANVKTLREEEIYDYHKSITIEFSQTLVDWHFS
jgi:hypothetical protein